MADDRRSDRELIDLCNRGDAGQAERAFGVLYERHKHYVIRVAFRYVPDADTALDVLQETFAYLLRKFPPTGAGLELSAELTTLLYTVTRSCAITLRRKADRFPADDERQPDDLPATPGLEAMDGRVEGALRSGLRAAREIDDLAAG